MASGIRAYSALLMGSCALPFLAQPPAALAQSSSPQTSASQATPATPETTLQEVVVTASKRESSLERTPIAITAVTGSDLLNRGVSSVASLVGDVPGLSIKSGGPGQTEFELRGLSSSGGSSPTVGFYLDDTSLTPPAASQLGKVVVDPDLYDLQRVEVLRGPQGTLYGSGSMGGTIRLITNPPKLDSYAATAQTSVSGTDGGGLNHVENFALNIPVVTDTLALRVVGTEAHTSGWIDRIVVGDFPLPTDGGLVRGDVQASPVLNDQKNANDEELTGTRVSLLYRPTPRLSITPTVFYQGLHQDGLSYFDSNPGALAHYEAFNDPESASDRFLLFGLTTKYDFNHFNLTSSTSDWSRQQKVVEDQAENIQTALGLPSVYVDQGGAGGNPIEEKDSVHQFSEELRIASSGTKRFQWLLGGYYSHFVAESDIIAITPGAVDLLGTSNFFSQVQPTKIDQEALFGEATLEIVPRLKATAGFRYYNYDTRINTTQSGAVSVTGSDASEENSVKQSSSGVNPKFNVSYQATNSLLLYSTIAKGFRPGGGNQPVPVSPSSASGDSCLAALEAFGKTQAPLSYQPDSVYSYEAGGKLSVGKRVTVNGAGYYENWSGVQQTVALSCGYPYTDNSGDARVYGGELEIHAVLLEGLTANGAAGYTNAELSKNNPETGGLKGDQLQNIAPWTASWSLNYIRPIANGLNATAGIFYNYVGSRIDATYFPMNHLPSYQLLDLRVGVLTQRWSAALFVKNAMNTRAFLSDSPSLSINIPTFNRVATNQPLTAGIDLQYRF